MRNSKLRFGGLLAATSALALGAAPAFAQDNEADSEDNGGLNEIVVTAQKRSQNLQDVPISIAAFDEEALQAERLESVEDIGRLSPGLYVTPNPADPTGVRINIRGVGTFDPQVGQDSRIAVYTDGVYLGKSQGLAFDSPDLERVEILKGPQGTLYGRNSVAGAVNLISAKPQGGEFFGKLTAEYGNFNHQKLSGALNIPLGDDAGIRVSGLYKSLDGWVENDGPGVDFGGSEQYGFRVAMGGDVTDRLNIVAAADYNRNRTEPLFYQSIPGFANPGSIFAAAVATSPGRQDEVTTPFRNERGDQTNAGASLTVNYEIAENHNLKFIGAYRYSDSSRFVTLVPTSNPAIVNAILGGINPLLLNSAFAGVPVRPDFAAAFSGMAPPRNGPFLSPPGGSPSLDSHKQYSAELTYNGEAADGSVTYTLGAFYYNEDTGTSTNFVGNTNDANSYLFVLAGLSPALGTASGLPTSPLVTLVTPGITPVQQATAVGLLSAIYGGARQSAANELRIDTEAFALYGEVTVNLTEALRVTGGLRWSRESKDGVGQPKSPFFLDNTDLLGNPILPNIGSFSFSKLNPSVVLEYDVNDDVLLYASFKQSFRSGGFNQGAVATRVPGTTAGSDFEFGREDINAYEIGMKGDFLDNRLRINAAAFYYDLSNLQTTVSLNPIVATARAVVNTDEEIWGGEIDITYAVTDELTLSGTYSYIDGNAGDVTNPLTMAVEVRDELQGTPKNSFRIGASYDGQLSDTVGLFANLNYSYKDDVLAVPQNALRLSTQNIVSGRIGVDFETSGGQEVSLALWGQNILDDKYQIDSLPFETFAFRTQVFGQPRTFGVTAGIKF